MDVQDAQREVRSVYVGGFWGQLVSSVIWLVSAALGTWVTPKASILTVVIGGFFIFPLTQMLLRLSGLRPLSKAAVVSEVIQAYGQQLPGAFAVLSPGNIRIRRGVLQ